MSYPFPAIDTGRTSERLSAFLSEIIESKPVDQYFKKYPTVERLMSSKRMIDGGAQLILPIGTGESPNNAWAGDYDMIGTVGTNVARTVTYIMPNIFDALIISWVELREIAGSDHKIFDRVDYKRSVVLNTTLKKINAGLYAAAQVATQVTALPVAIKSTGTLGGVSDTDYSQWSSQLINHAAAFTAGGYENMLYMHQKIKLVKGETSAILTTFAIERAIEAEWNVDVRYADSPDTLKRGSNKLMFKNIPVIADNDCTALAMYFIDESSLKMYVDTDGDMAFEEMVPAPYQKAFISKFAFRGQVAVTDRRAQGYITNVS